MICGRAASFVKGRLTAGRCAGGYAAKPPTKPLDRPRQTCESGAMAKFRSSYVCQNCGAITQRWQGKCESCGEWNTIIEEAVAAGIAGARRSGPGRAFALEGLTGASRVEARIVTGLGELDRVTGGGFVAGS